jgi:hypothetical protein
MELAVERRPCRNESKVGQEAETEGLFWVLNEKRVAGGKPIRLVKSVLGEIGLDGRATLTACSKDILLLPVVYGTLCLFLKTGSAHPRDPLNERSSCRRMSAMESLAGLFARYGRENSDSGKEVSDRRPPR